MFCAMSFVVVGLGACQNDPGEGDENVVATMSAEVSKTEANTAEIVVTTTGIKELAYQLLFSTEDAPMAVVLFKDGVVVPVNGETTTIALDDLEYDTNYTLHIAARVASKKGGFYNEVVAVDFSTADYTEEVTVIRLNYDGADIHVKFPEAVKQRGNKLKWFVNSIPGWKDWKNPQLFYNADADIVQQNDLSFPAFLIHRDTTLRITDANRIFISPYDSTEEAYYNFIAPGEPIIVSIQEVSWMESPVGWGEGWYGTPFLLEQFYDDLYSAAGDGGGIGWSNSVQIPTRAQLPDEEDYWPEDSWHKTLKLTTKQPDVMDAKVEIGLEGYDGSNALSPKGGKITLNPEEGVFCYCVSLLDHSLYQSILLECLEGKKNRMQWFTSSYYAAASGLAATFYANAGPTSIDISEWFVGSVKPGGTYHVFVTAMGGKEGAAGMEADFARQSFNQFSFEIPNYTLPEPVIEVTGLEPSSAFEARFLVKCTSADTAPLEKASYAANYARDFNVYIKDYEYTYADLVAMNTAVGVYFTDAEIKEMNSPSGCIVTIPSREDAESGLVVQGWNYEGRPSNPDAEGSKAYATARSGIIPDAERVESTLFTDLLGDWTATVTLSTTETVYVQDADGNYVEDAEGNYVTETVTTTKDVKSKVTIGDLTAPETLTQEVIDLYASAGVSEAQTKVYFDEFKTLTTQFNKKTRGQNRLLCQGLDIDELEWQEMTTYKSAWDLFVTTEGYSASTTDLLFYDFGPKWYLQIDKNGNVFVPVNINRIAPLSYWTGAELHLVALDVANNQALISPETDSDDASTWPNLPVEISEDKNTITIKPFVYNAGEGAAPQYYYPNILSNASYGMLPMNGINTGNIVLTRGYKEMITVTAVIDNEISRSNVAQRNVAPVKSANGAVAVKKNMKGHTNFKALLGDKPAVKYTKAKVEGINSEKFFQNIRAAHEQQLKAKGVLK